MANIEEEMNLFRPPLVKASTTLNRALFAKTINIAAARVRKPQDIGRYRKIFEAGKEILDVPRISAVAADPDATLASQGRRCLLLRPGIKPEGLLFRYSSIQNCWTKSVLQYRKPGVLLSKRPFKKKTFRSSPMSSSWTTTTGATVRTTP